MSPAVRAWAVGLVAGLLAGVAAAVLAVHLSPGGASRPPGDRVRHAIEGLEQDHFYVGPELRDRLTDAQFRAIARAAQSAATPTYLVWWADVGYDAGYLGDQQADEQIMAAIGKKGYYSIVSDAGSGVEVDAVGYDAPWVDDELAQGRPEVALLRYVKALGATPPEPEDRSGDYWGGPFGGLVLACLIAVPAFFVVMALVALASRLRRRP